ncbi:MAG: oligosaccharide flippase family protein [Bacteroidetes bacterium]|nr:oligosaccharide flippase family protein [Bacteroidota bacterium]
MINNNNNSMPSNNKRIAKNTLMLYFRMFITMVVSLYTSRIVLNTLGIEDFGIYNIVGSVVVLFSFLNSAMSGATQRFLNFELGKKDFNQLSKVFSASLSVHILIALIILLLSETIGLWFMNTQLNLPQERMYAAKWVYQFTIITFIIGVIKVPYNASIIAHERMSFYAYISIIEVFLKLVIVFILQLYGEDKLIFYALLISVVTLVIFVVFIIYCHQKFDSTHYHFFIDKNLYKQLLSFSGWSLFGSVANVGKIQIINIFLNIFCGVTVNAARGIANQVSNALNNFVSNFQIAFNPQIVKSYAANEKTNFLKLIFQTSKFSCFLLFFLSLPVLINTEYILKLWLKIVPEYTAEFCQLTIIYLLIESISGPLWMSVQATGKIKNYQIVISSVLLLNIPISYILLKYNFAPYSVMWGNIGISIIALIIRIIFLKKLVKFPTINFINDVLFRIIIVTIFSIPLPLIINHFLNSDLLSLIITTIVAFISVSVTIYYIGLKKEERLFVINELRSFFKRE